ncbi:MAG: hypothetical protein Q8P31_01605 [Bacillota bacterium]|nr:hypothetical protein [Bacillota bacterium]
MAQISGLRSRAVGQAAELVPWGYLVMFAGRIPNLFAGWWPDVDPNDLAVETSSTYLPPG